MMKKRFRVLLLFGFFILAGCGSRLTDIFLCWDQDTGGQPQTRLDEGNRLFQEGSYSEAEAVFQDLQATEDQEVIRPALFGLACSRLMLAENKQEYLEAIEVLEHWQRISPELLDEEDPRMLLAFFSKVHSGDLGGDSDNSRASEGHFSKWFSDCEERIDELEDQIAGLKKEITAYKKQMDAAKEIEAANKTMEQTLKKKESAMQSMAEELSKLRGQIKTLETIDQEIQEKKQGISSP